MHTYMYIIVCFFILLYSLSLCYHYTGLEKCYSIVCLDIQNNKITRVSILSHSPVPSSFPPSHHPSLPPSHHPSLLPSHHPSLLPTHPPSLSSSLPPSISSSLPPPPPSLSSSLPPSISCFTPSYYLLYIIFL